MNNIRETEQRITELVQQNKTSNSEFGSNAALAICRASALIAEFGTTEEDKNLTFEMIREDDSATFELLRSPDQKKTIPLINPGMMDILRSMQPVCYEDLVAAYALHRPAALELGLVDRYIDQKHESETDNYKFSQNYSTPLLAPILNNTYGVVLYQQQVISIAMDIADFAREDADKLVVSLGVRGGEEAEPFRDQFSMGCLKSNLGFTQINNLFEQLKKYSGGYFDRESAKGGAFYLHRLAWLTVHYPIHLRAALITLTFGDTEAIQNEIWTCREVDITVMPPDINYSHAECTPESNNTIRIGLGAVIGIGHTSVEHILEVRKNLAGETAGATSDSFASFEGFLKVIDLNIVKQEEIEQLIKAGVFKFLIRNPKSVMGHLGEIILGIKKLGRVAMAEFDNTSLPVWSRAEKLAEEYDVLGCYVSKHPLYMHIPHFLKEDLGHINFTKKYDWHTIFARVVSVHVHSDSTPSGTQEFASVVLDDPNTRKNVFIGSDVYPEIKEVLKPNNLLLVYVRAITSKWDKVLEPRIKIIDAYKIDRKLPDIPEEEFHFYRVRYLSEKALAESVIEKCVDHIRHDPEHPKQIQFDYSYIPIFDDKTYAFLHQGYTEGLFEFDTPSCQQTLRALKPDSFEQLLVATVLSSPAHFEYMFDDYVECAKDHKEPSYLIPELKPILEPTFGFIIYQEQIREIVETLAGYSKEESKVFYRALASKSMSEMPEVRQCFMQAVSNIVMTEDEASYLFDWLEKFSGPARKKESLIEPVTTSYRMAWLKVHYPKEFERAFELA